MSGINIVGSGLLVRCDCRVGCFKTLETLSFPIILK